MCLPYLWRFHLICSSSCYQFYCSLVIFFVASLFIFSAPFFILPLAHLSVLSAVYPPVSFSPCCRGDASFRPVVIESHEYFSRHPSSHISSCHLFFHLSSVLFHSRAASPSFSRHHPLPPPFTLSSPSFTCFLHLSFGSPFLLLSSPHTRVYRQKSRVFGCKNISGSVTCVNTR